jgi:hypothetical protein
MGKVGRLVGWLDGWMDGTRQTKTNRRVRHSTYHSDPPLFRRTHTRIPL